MKPTAPQQIIIDSVLGSISKNHVVYGVPGAGKTTLIKLFVERFLESGITDILALTFSTALAQNMQGKITGATVQTTHSYMYQALKTYLKIHNISGSFVKDHDKGKYTHIDNELLRKYMYNYVKTMMGIMTPHVPAEHKKEFYSLQFKIIDCVNAIRNGAYNYVTHPFAIHEKFDLTYGEVIVKEALIALKALSDRFFQRGMTDFTGMLYLPLVHPELIHYIKSPERLILDETNDTTPLLDSAYRIIGRNSVVLAVGDKKQTIHIWAGANPNCMDILSKYYEAHNLSYDFTFRVPKAMCKYLNDSKIDTRIKPYDSNNEGKIEFVSFNKFLAKVYNGDIVLCRYNRGKKVKYTLAHISIELLKLRKKVAFHGSTHIEDISELLGMATLPTKFNHEAITQAVEAAVTSAISTEYSEKHLTKDNWRCEELRDKLATFKLYFKFYKATVIVGASIKKFMEFLNDMYSTSESAIQLYSIHRSKGLEGHRVWIFHTEAMTEVLSNENASYNEKVEAHNLLLVALTRSDHETYLVECTLPEYLPDPVEQIVV